MTLWAFSYGYLRLDHGLPVLLSWFLALAVWLTWVLATLTGHGRRIRRATVLSWAGPPLLAPTTYAANPERLMVNPGMALPPNAGLFPIVDEGTWPGQVVLST